MKNPTPVSIIIPTLNEEDYIGNLLASLVAQNYQNFEVIVIDGKSKDQTQKVCDKFKPLLPSLKFVTCRRRGVSHQRNLGANSATNEHLLFLDADLIVPSTFLTIAMTEITKENADLATCYIWPLSNNLLDYTLHLVGNVGVDIAKYILPAIFGCTIFTTKKLHKQIGGFNEKMHFTEDQEYAQKAVKKGAKFLILRNTYPYVSVRRLDYEGRLSVLKKGLLYVIMTAAYGKEKAQKYINHDSVDYEKVKMGIKLSAKKAGLTKGAIEELHDIFNPFVKYPIQGSRFVLKGAKSVVRKLNRTLLKILEE